MFVIKRNSVIIAALVVMIAFAGYLNYADSRNTPEEDLAVSKDNYSSLLLDDSSGQEVSIYKNDVDDNLTGTALISDSSEINTDDDIGIAMTQDETQPEGASENEPGTAVFVNSTNDSSFFVQAKLEREQARSKDKETLMQLINNTNLEKEQRSSYADQVLEIQERIGNEISAEAMIEAKGFTEAYVRIDENGVEVVVSKKVLSDAEIAQIEDIIKRKTGFEVEKIRISPLKS